MLYVDFVLFPVIVDRRQMYNTHENYEAHVGLQLSNGHMCPLFELLFHALQSILVCLLHNVLQQRRGEEQKSSTGDEGSRIVGPVTSVNGVTVTRLRVKDHVMLSALYR